VALYLRQSTASACAALCAAIPAGHPVLPGVTCLGRSASGILTSPTLRAAEVRIPPAPLRSAKVQEGRRIRNRAEESGHWPLPVVAACTWRSRQRRQVVVRVTAVTLALLALGGPDAATQAAARAAAERLWADTYTVPSSAARPRLAPDLAAPPRWPGCPSQLAQPVPQSPAIPRTQLQSRRLATGTPITATMATRAHASPFTTVYGK
jgi:hypothetical protein